MQALKILVVEDDLFLAERIADDLSGMGYTISGNVANSDDALRAFRKNLPDLAVLDINLQGSKLDGIELAQQFNKIVKVPLIFLTGIGGTETVERAKKVNPSYYLVKPYNLTQLSISIDFAISNFVKGQEAEVKHSLQFHTPPPCVFYSTKDFFFTKKGSKYIRIEIADIIYVKSESPGNNVRIITEYDNLFLSAGIKSFLQQTPHQSLVRVNRSYIVNINKIVAYEASKKLFLDVNKKQIPITIGDTYKEKIQEILPRLKSE